MRAPIILFTPPTGPVTSYDDEVALYRGRDADRVRGRRRGVRSRLRSRLGR